MLLLAACGDTVPPTGPTGPSVSAAATQGSRAEDRYIVVFRPGTANADRLTDQLTVGGGTVHFRYRTALQGFAASLPAAALDGIRRNPNVAFVEADGEMQAITTTQTGATWGIDRIDQRSLPLSSSYSYDQDGTGVTAYIIDTGIRPDHNEFGGRVSSGGFTAISDKHGTEDCNGHGTHVSGTVGGSTYGVAKNVALVPVRVLNCRGSGSYSGVIAGIDWVAANASGPSVANMSLGGGASSSVDAAVNGAAASGVVMVVAAGNSNANACNYSPARAADAVTVGATTSNDGRASYSNYGTCLDLFAPGSGITSAWHNSPNATNTISGTSMASPHVAGAAALLLEANPGAGVASITATLLGNATPGTVGNRGAGSPNLLLFTNPGGGGEEPPPDNSPPTAGFSWECIELDCAFTDTSSDSDGSVDAWSWSFEGGGGSSAQHPNHTFPSTGSYLVTLVVTDNGGANDNVSHTVTVATTPVPGGFSLSGSGYKVKGRNTVDLTWSGAAGATVDILRDGALIATVSNDGSHTDNTGERGGATYAYQVCEAGTSTCSNSVTVEF
jgi:subtilisin family serine protease